MGYHGQVSEVMKSWDVEVRRRRRVVDWRSLWGDGRQPARMQTGCGGLLNGSDRQRTWFRRSKWARRPPAGEWDAAVE